MNNDKIELNGIINSNDNLVANLSSDETLNANIVSGQIQVSTDDHTKLRNRDVDNQHPINAIEGLQEELLSIKNTQVTTNLSIKNLENRINNKIRTSQSIPQDMIVGDYIFLEKEGE